ncbi:ribonuclease H-like domain-containing protein [Tanacetum coccineum]
MTLIEVARTMLADSLLPTIFWAEAVNTACYVQNRLLVTKPHNKTPYELLHGRPPSISFMRSFRCHVTILNTLDPLGKFDGKADEGFLVGYLINNKAFRVFNTRTRKVEVNLHITFLENKPNVARSGPYWLFDIDLLINSMNYEPVTAGNQTNGNAEDAVADDVGKKTTEEPANKGERNGQEKEGGALNKEGDQNVQDLRTELDNLLDTTDLLNTGIFSGAYDDDDDDEGAEANLNNLETTMNVYRNNKDKRGIVVRNKARLVAQGYTQEEGIYYDEVFAPIARIEAIRLFLAYASFMRFIVYQMDVKSAFLYGTIEEEVYVCQPPSFEDLQFPDKVYKVNQKEDGIFICQDKYVADILKKFNFATVKIASTLIETNKALLKDEEAEDVDVHLYRSMIGSLLLNSSRPDIIYLKGQPKLGLYYPRDSPFDLEAFSDSDYAGASLDRKSHKRRVDGISDEFGVKTGSCKVNAVRQDLVLLGETKTNNFKEKVNTARVNNVTTAGPKAVVSAAEGNGENAEEQVPAIATSHPQKTQTPRQAKRGRDTKIPQSGGPPEKVGDEAIHKELGDRVERAATTATSLDAEQDSESMGGTIAQTSSERVPTPSYDSPLLGGNTPGSDEERLEHQDYLMDFIPLTPHDSPLSGGYTPGSDEGRPNTNELMVIYINLSNKVLALETSKTAQDLVIKMLKKKVRKLEKKLRARTLGMKLFNFGTSKRKSLDEEYVSKQERKSDKTKPMFDDSDFDELDVDNAKENVEGDAETQGRNTAKQITTNRDTVNTASIDVSVVGPSNVSTTDPSTSTVRDIFKDEMMTIADTLVAIRSTRPRTTSVPEPTLKNLIKAQIQRDAEITQRLFEEDQQQFEREQRIARERVAEQEAKDAALIKQIEDIQARMDADELQAERLQQDEREQFTIEEKSRMLVEMIVERKRLFAAQRAKQIRNKPPTRAQLRNKMKWINDFVPIDSEVVKDSRKGKAEGGRKKTVARKRTGEKLDDESVKRRKIEDDAENEALRAYLDIISGDDEAINVESLAIKYPIVDWKTHALSEDKMCYEIIKGDGTTNSYKIFTEMLNDFDRQDVLDLYRLIKEIFETASPEGYDRLLWRDLITLFEPSKDDDIWKAQQDYTLISWTLFESCGIYVLLMDTGISIHMMIEKTYPLTQEMLSRMLSRRLEVDHECEIAYELLRKVTSIKDVSPYNFKLETRSYLRFHHGKIGTPARVEQYAQHVSNLKKRLLDESLFIPLGDI